MCSIQDEGATLPEEGEPASIDRMCMKCNAKAVTIARTKDPFCGACFHDYFTHRFRTTLGKSRLVRAGERVLLAFSGGPSSRVLLELVKEGHSEHVHKKLRFVPSIISIDEGVVVGQDWEERCQHMIQALSIAAQSGFPTYFTQLEQVFGSCEAYRLDDCTVTKHGSSPSHPSSLLGHVEGATPSVKSEGESTSVPSLTKLQLNEDTPLDVHLHEDPPPSPEADSGGQTASETQVEKEQMASPRLPQPLHECPPVCERGDTSQFEDGGASPSQSESKTGNPMVESSLATEISLKMLELKRAPSLELQLKKLFDSTKSVTAKENLLLSLRHQLLVEIARRNGFTKVLVGDSATRLAVRLLGNVAQGRGGTLPFDTGFADDRVKDVLIVRPVREFPAQELIAYAALHNLQTSASPSLATLTPDKTSIERLTESFITGLQANFPSTVNTIFRTGDKLSVHDDVQTTKPCSLCQAPRGHIADKTVFTHLNIPDELSGKPVITDTWNSLCYGCQLTVKDMGYKVDSLPHVVHTEARKIAGRAKMRAEIDEFLLDTS